MKPRISLSMVFLFLLLCVIPGQAQGPEAQAVLGTGFTYQGQLRQGGSPVSETCDFQFLLWTESAGGNQFGPTLTKTAVEVTRGLFTVLLDFGAGAFNGDARWLGIRVRCPAGSGSYTTLSPRQAISAAPYALYALGGPPAVPAGVIVMWSGSLDAIPVGWALCDGTNGTPDLRDKFVRGAAAGEDPGKTGGVTAHQHTVAAHTHVVDAPLTASSTGGSHTHTLPSASAGKYVSDCQTGDDCSWVSTYSHTHDMLSAGAHLHNVDIAAFTSASATSTTNAVSNIPPYYTVAYIMKQ